MAELLYRFESLLIPSQLADVLQGGLHPPAEKTGETANLEPVEKALHRLTAKAGTRKSDYDVELCELLHKQLRHIPDNLKVDMRFWQWLTVKRFPKFVWIRWSAGIPTDIKAALARGGMADRFLGNKSLRGKNRNALSRLFFAAEILHDKVEGYKLATAAFTNQDRHTSIFEREMGLIPAAAKALIRVTKGMGSEGIQETATPSLSELTSIGLGERPVRRALAVSGYSNERPDDTSLVRVANRIFERGNSPQKSRVESQITTAMLVGRDEGALLYAAAIELGTTICTPSEPACMLCPVAEHCSHLQG